MPEGIICVRGKSRKRRYFIPKFPTSETIDGHVNHKSLIELASDVSLLTEVLKEAK